MNDKNTRELVSAFPTLYSGRTPGRTGFAFECDDGWYRLIYDLSQAVYEQAIEDGFNSAEEGFPTVRQVKEKFGTLRFYLSFYTSDTVHQLITAAEEKSYDICERCGLAGELRSSNWIHVSCHSCEEKLKQLRNQS
jgi:hypothetical protein